MWILWKAVLMLGAFQPLVFAEPTPWWTNAVFYRVVVDSFKDTNSDGLGDINGVNKQLSYVRAIGADAVILSPVFSRSKDCGSPGILDLSEVDDRYGTVPDVANLLEKANKIELKVVLTLPLQTVSAKSEWFFSSADKVGGFEDRILWQDGNVEEPPKGENGISWTFHEGRNSYFATQESEPLVNLCSESVAADFSRSLCFWQRLGVSGFLLNPDFPPAQVCGEKLLKKLAADAMACARSGNLQTPIIMVESALPQDQAASYYGNRGVGANSVLNAVLAAPEKTSAVGVGIALQTALLTTPDDGIATWITSTPEGSRISSRYGNELIDSINLLALILPGAAIIQQGDELGSADAILEWATSDKCWPNSPTPSYAPMSWDESPNAGFSEAEPWLPLSPNYRYANAKAEYANSMSHASVVKLTAAMRKSPAIGPHVEIKRLGGALAVLRWGGPGSLLVVCNLDVEATDVQLSNIPGLPSQVTVAMSSAGSALAPGAHLPVDKALRLGPGETLLLAGGPRHCGGPGPVDKIASKLSEGWQKLNKYFGSK